MNPNDNYKEKAVREPCSLIIVIVILIAVDDEHVAGVDVEARVGAHRLRVGGGELVARKYHPANFIRNNLVFDIRMAGYLSNLVQLRAVTPVTLAKCAPNLSVAKAVHTRKKHDLRILIIVF